MQVAQRAAHDESGGVFALGGIEEELRQRSERDRRDLNKQQQRTQPEAEGEK